MSTDTAQRGHFERVREHLDAIYQAHAAATPGPWDVRWQCPEEAHHHDWDEGWIATPDGATVAVLGERYTSVPADAAAIVAAHAALPGLIAAVRAVLDLADEDDTRRDDYGYRIRNGLDPSPGDRIRAAVATALGAQP